MKVTYTLIAFTLLTTFASCTQDSEDAFSSQGQHSIYKISYGKNYSSPNAITDQEPFAATTTSGPVDYAPNIPSASDMDTVDVRIDIQHKLITVTDDVKFWGWTFGDSIPGPVVKVKVGQTVRFKMSNRSLETAAIAPPMPHSVDFHSAMVNPEDKYKSVDPGKTLSFEWTANYPGVFMYHCGTPLILHHMIQGMYGMVIVEPKEGFPGKVDKEFSIIQCELYLKEKEDGSYIVDLDAARRKQPTYVTFNGKPRFHLKNPLKANAGDRVRLYLCNVGPNDQTSFHVVGTIFDKVWLDGNPANELRGMQTVLLGSSSTAIIEFVIPEKGTYAFVDHEFADVEAGALGLIKAE